MIVNVEDLTTVAHAMPSHPNLRDFSRVIYRGGFVTALKDGKPVAKQEISLTGNKEEDAYQLALALSRL